MIVGHWSFTNICNFFQGILGFFLQLRVIFWKEQQAYCQAVANHSRGSNLPAWWHGRSQFCWAGGGSSLPRSCRLPCSVLSARGVDGHRPVCSSMWIYGAVTAAVIKFILQIFNRPNTVCKSGIRFPHLPCSCVITVSEIWGEKRCPLPPDQAVSLRKLPSTRLSAVPICSSARVCHGDYQSDSWQPYRILHAREQAADQPHLTAGLFTHVCANTHVHTDCLSFPLLPSWAHQWVRASRCCASSMLMAGRSAKCRYVFTLTKQGRVYIVCIEPSFPHLADIHALMRVQSSPIQSMCW